MKTLLKKLVDLFIKRNWFSNCGKFRKGDIVKYNWKAQVSIATAIDNSTHQIKKLDKYADGTEHFECDCGQSGDVFWVRKARFYDFWE